MLPGFQAYDIRGIYPDEINETLANAVARAFVHYCETPAVVVGRDMRLSSPFLATAVVNALLDEGVYVIDVGMVPGPVVDFAMRAGKFLAGIYITASHNPPEYNGLKLRTLHNDLILQTGAGHGLEEISLKTEKLLRHSGSSNFRAGKYLQSQIVPEYLEYLTERTGGILDLKVVADYGNGVGGVTAVPLLDQLKVSATHLFAEPDGTYPNHLADPHHLENFSALQEAITNSNSDIGLFFDGDADRLALVDEAGHVVAADFVLALLAEERLRSKKFQDFKVFHDLRASRGVINAIKRCGGEPCLMPVGNTHYKRILARTGGLLAGENSGHIMFPENGASDDGLYTAIEVLKILSNRNKKLSTLLANYATHARLPEFQLPRPASDLETMYAKVQAAFPDANVSRLDGLTLEARDWWLNIRPSNTEPILRVNLEAENKSLLEQLASRLRSRLRQ